MKHKLCLLLIVLLIVGCVPFQPLTKRDIALEVTWLAINAIDCAQTRTISRNPDKWYEVNPILGKHPSITTVNLVWVVTSLGHPLITWILPPKYRPIWQGLTIGGSGLAIINNMSKRIHPSF